jgi:CRP-like cAMP-binding protein/Fe-S-cluster-containing hydrogenase component 2
MTQFRLTLAEQVAQEINACIGCHDCLLACPLPQASAVSIAELNEAIHQPVISAQNVVDFLSACTQCRQCVPACPADLSRADMVLFNKMKVEDQVPNQELMLQVGTGVTPSGITLDGLAEQLAGLKLLEGVDRGDLRRMLLSVTLRRLEVGEVLCREGAFHDRLTIVVLGVVEQTASGPGGQQMRIVLLGSGSFFGEMAVLADQPEPFSVLAVAPSVVVEIPKAAVHRLMGSSGPFRQTMEDLHAARALWTYANKPSSIGQLPEEAVRELLGHAELQMLKAGEVLSKEGARPRDVYIVKSGFLRVSRTLPHGEVTLVYFREGDFFGLLPLLMGESAHPYTVAASSRAELIRLPGPTFTQVVSRYEQARPGLMAAAIEAEQAARATAWSQATAPQPAPPAGSRRKAPMTVARELSIDVLIEQGVAQGREVLVVDQSRCTSCQNCIDACGRRHGESRLQLRGLQVENFLFPTACRHCDDPVCLLCSVSGIVRKPTGEISIVEENCIGCGACAERCPYGNITMHPVHKPKRGIWAALGDYLWGRRGEQTPAAGEGDGLLKAVKCDLCADYQDYACVTACPVGAAFRIDPAALGFGGEPVGVAMRQHSR